MTGKKKNRAKNKEKTISLSDFLGGESQNVVVTKKSTMSSWADEPEEEAESRNYYDDEEEEKVIIDRSCLPTAPRASREPDCLDLERVPKDPPFTCFIGNMPFDASEGEIAKFFGKLQIVSIRIPDHSRGTGYADFEDRQNLINALSMNDEPMRGRTMGVDLTEQKNQRTNDNKHSDCDSSEDKTLGDWRRKPAGGEGGYRDGDRNKGAYGDHEKDGYADRERGSYSERDRLGRSDDFGGSWRTGGDRDRGGDIEKGGYSERERPGKRDDFGGSWRTGGDRDRGGDREKGGYSERERPGKRDDFGGSWRTGGDRDRGGDREKGGYSERERPGKNDDFGGSWRTGRDRDRGGDIEKGGYSEHERHGKSDDFGGSWRTGGDRGMPGRSDNFIGSWRNGGDGVRGADRKRASYSERDRPGKSDDFRGSWRTGKDCDSGGGRESGGNYGERDRSGRSDDFGGSWRTGGDLGGYVRNAISDHKIDSVPSVDTRNEKRERHLPKSVDEMPQLKTSTGKCWSAVNKFSSLDDDAGDLSDRAI